MNEREALAAVLPAQVVDRGALAVKLCAWWDLEDDGHEAQDAPCPHCWREAGFLLASGVLTDAAQVRTQALRDAASAVRGMHDPVTPDLAEWADWLDARAAREPRPARRPAMGDREALDMLDPHVRSMHESLLTGLDYPAVDAPALRRVLNDLAEQHAVAEQACIEVERLQAVIDRVRALIDEPGVRHLQPPNWRCRVLAALDGEEAGDA